MDGRAIAYAGAGAGTIAYAGATLLIGALVLLPDPAVRARFVGGLSIAAIIAWLVYRDVDARDSVGKSDERTRRRTRKCVTTAPEERWATPLPTGSGSSKKRFASISPESYGLRVPADGSDAAQKAVRAGLVPFQILALAKRVGNQAAASKLVAALLDLEMRCRFVEATANEYVKEAAPKSIQVRVAHEVGVIQASHQVAMDTMQELTMRLPGGKIAKSYAKLARNMHTRIVLRIRRVCKRWYWCKQVRMAAVMAGCDHHGSPQPHDPTRAHMLY